MEEAERALPGGDGHEEREHTHRRGSTEKDMNRYHHLNCIDTDRRVQRTNRLRVGGVEQEGEADARQAGKQGGKGSGGGRADTRVSKPDVAFGIK
jgi:hypothetical protein